MASLSDQISQFIMRVQSVITVKNRGDPSNVIILYNVLYNVYYTCKWNGSKYKSHFSLRPLKEYLDSQEYMMWKINNNQNGGGPLL